MQFLIQLPPEQDRLELINSWVVGFISEDHNFQAFDNKVKELINRGFSHHGLTVFMLHNQTHEFIADRLKMEIQSPMSDAITALPISLN